MKLSLTIFVICIGAAYATYAESQGYEMVFGQLEHYDGQPYKILGSIQISIAEACGEQHVQRVIKFPGENATFNATIHGIKHIDSYWHPADVNIIDGRIGESSITVKLSTTCGHESLLEFYGEYILDNETKFDNE